MVNALSINFDNLKEIALIGIRRASVFMAFGVNAARDEKFKSYEILNLCQFRVIPENISDETISGFKNAFEQWIISNGLRELVESFASFLNGIHDVCLLVAINKGRLSHKDAKKSGIAFKKDGIESQLKTLRDRFSISTTREKYFGGINQIRNCFTHRQGKVGPEDLKNETFLQISWLGMNTYIKTPDGEKHDFMPPFPKEGKILKNGGEVFVEFVDRVRNYRLGEIVSFSPNDLGEIGLLFNLATDDIARSTLEYVKSMGVEVKIVEKVKPAPFSDDGQASAGKSEKL